MGDSAAFRIPAVRELMVQDFRFHTGQVMPSLRLRATVLGNPEGVPVLVLHGTGGSGGALLSPDFGGQLFGPGQPLDAAHHHIVLPDAIGHGGSAKPSDGLRADFPAYNYEDIVEGQYCVACDVFGARRLRLVLGVSMGGMQAWLWGIRFAGLMDALVPLSSLPAAMSGRNWLMRRLLVDAIRGDPTWQQGRYAAQPAGLRAAYELFNVATNGGTLALQAAAPDRAHAEQWLAARRAQPLELDANDMIHQWQAALDYDPSGRLGEIQADVLAIHSTDDERNPPETGIARHAIAQLPRARLLMVPGGADTRGHGTVGLARLWAEDLRSFLAQVPGGATRLLPARPPPTPA